jgi:hypothetical protein
VLVGDRIHAEGFDAPFAKFELNYRQFTTGKRVQKSFTHANMRTLAQAFSRPTRKLTPEHADAKVRGREEPKLRAYEQAHAGDLQKAFIYDLARHGNIHPLRAWLAREGALASATLDQPVNLSSTSAAAHRAALAEMQGTVSAAVESTVLEPGTLIEILVDEGADDWEKARVEYYERDENVHAVWYWELDAKEIVTQENLDTETWRLYDGDGPPDEPEDEDDGEQRRIPRRIS